MSLRLDWCSHAAAEYACVQWHYSRKMPAGKLVKIGVWEAGAFIGAVVFGRGNNVRIGWPFKLPQTEICELVRIALRAHQAPVSKIVSIAIRLLRKQSPGIRLLVSYADPAQQHHGGIYQAMGWTYAGSSSPQRELRVAGQFLHKRSATSRWGTASPDRIKALTGLTDVCYGPVEWKHTYYLALDPALRPQAQALSKPYPKRAGSILADAPVDHTGEDGAAPIPALPFSNKDLVDAP